MALEEIEIEGYLGHDPSKPSPQNYPDLVSFSVGVSQSRKDKQTGEWVSTTTWYKVSSWSESRASYLYQTLKKGDKVVVKGRPSIEQWQGKDGLSKASININLEKIVMPPKKEQGSVANQNTASTNSDYAHLDDDIPF